MFDVGFVEIMLGVKTTSVTLWSPWTLVFSAAPGGFALIGFSALGDPDEIGGPIWQAVYLAMGVVALVLTVRSPLRRVIVRGSKVIQVGWFGRRRLRVVAVDVGDADGPASVLWTTSVPVVVLADGEEVALSELAGFDVLGRRNRRVQRARGVLESAASHASRSEPDRPIDSGDVARP
ncbi:hypothetical protein [Segeticoccus rhizosphaerae]|uniref:hypothetical protein n=1 Tax=Segeticoccus rhizosphaerae TaxID=1104777 RepID=UPI0010BFFF74|nr:MULTISPECIES: hypothetical protein [Intrasporangiaceae]